MPSKALQLEMNWLDRAIGYVAPIWGARRMQSRYTMAAAQHMASGLVTGVRRLSGSGEGTLGNWNPRREQRLAENRSFDTIMARAESLVANDGHAASSVSSLALNVAGPGLRPQSYPDHTALGITEDQAEAFADSAEAAWGIWCKEAHAGDTLTFDDLQYQAVHGMFVTGEFLHLPAWLDEPGRTFGLAIQDLHPARLRTPSDLQHRAEVRCGVHLGKYNRPLGYFIANPSDNTSSLSSLTSDHFTYVPRKIGHRYACLHRFHSDMPEQLRGVSILSPAMKLFRDLSDYVDYELVGALIAASFTVFIEAPGDPLGSMGGGGLDGKSTAGPTAAYPPQLQPGNVAAAEFHLRHTASRLLRACTSSLG